MGRATPARSVRFSGLLFPFLTELHGADRARLSGSRNFIVISIVLLLTSLSAAQSVTVSPASLSFGNEALSIPSSAKTVTLKNGTSTALTISSIGASGEYSDTTTCGASLSAGASCTISVTFTPSATGSRTGTITVTDSASNSPQTVSLTGTGVLQATVSPASLSFGSLAVQTTSAAKTVTLKNNLPTALSVSSIAVTGDYAQTNTCGASLAAGASCTVSVTFTPVATGSRTGTLTITDSASNSPQTVSLTGTGIVQVTVAPATLSFGNQAVGTSSVVKTLTVTNNLGTALSVSSIAVSGDFAQTNTCGTSVAAGANCTVSVTFTPTATGSRTGTLTITDSANNSPQTVSLAGNGVVPVTVTPATLVFGSVAVTATSAAKTVTVTNKQPTAVTVTSITTPSAYAQTNTCGSLLAAQGTCTVSVTFSPTTTGSQPGTLTITDNASNSPQTVNLTGTGTALATITSLSITSGVVGTAVTITGTGFGGSQGSSTVTFNGVAATPTSWKATAIAATVPAAATTGNVVVTVNGGPSNGVKFSVNPTVSSLSATSGIAGTAITIAGTGFGATQGSSTVTFGGTTATPTNWSTTTITVPVPAGATGGSGSVVVTVGGVASNAAAFTVVPSITALSPTSGSVGTSITITGTGFGANQGTSTVTFNNTTTVSTSWSSGSITAPVPTSATTGSVIVTIGGVASNSVTFNVISGGFVATTGQMVEARYGQTATQLTNGQILMAGGMGSSGVLNIGELYTPITQTFVATANSMNAPRWLHTATLLNDGTVLLVGGSSLSNQTTLNSAEIYDPVAGTFTLLATTLNTARVGHSATLLANGQVLIVGGFDPTTGIIADSELYDPAAQVFIDVGNTNTPRFHHTATLLQSNQVLITGGATDATPSGAYNTAETFNPATWTFSPVSANMISGREGHSATRLNDGTVLIAGGDLPPASSLGSAELYNPATNTFTALSAAMTSPRIYQTAVLLNGGKVLIAGGEIDAGGSGAALNSAELYDPAAQIFTPVSGNMTSVREHQTATLLNDGTVLEAGGNDGTNAFNTAEVYTASKLTGLTSITISPASPSVPLGTQLPLTATGTFSIGPTQVLSSVSWSSSAAGVSTVSNDVSNSGYLTTTAQGTATLTATALGISGSTTVTVPAPSLLSITVSPQSAFIPLGTSQQLSVSGIYSDGSVQDLTLIALWSSSSPSASVSGTGVVSGASRGTATVQASYGSAISSTTVTVGAPALISIAISPSNASIALGTSQQYQVIGTYTDSTTQDITNAVEWSWLPANIVTVSSTGLASASSRGTVTVQAALGTVSGSALLTVTPAALTSVTISPSNSTIDIGGTEQLSASGTYSNFSSTDLTASSTWASSNPSIATVSPTGFMTAIASGTVTITANSGSVSGTATLSVTTTAGVMLNTSRYEHTATLLNDGTVLIAGGITCPSPGSCSYLTSAEVYNPDTGTSTSTGSLATARSATAVLLPDGEVLIAGGYSCDSSGNCTSLSSAELFNPNGYFISAGNMTVARSGHTMTVLSNGRVLIAGGQNCTAVTACTALNTAEMFDPVSGTFSPTGNLNAARFNASATALTQGLVLIAGGFDGTNYPAAAELFDPAAGTFSVSASLNTPRANATATLLNGGKVLIAGGSSCSSPACPLNSAELYDASAGVFSYTGSMNVSRFDHTAALLTNGQVLLGGGYNSCPSSCTSDATTELYDPTARVFAPSQTLSAARSEQTATLLSSGEVIVLGGINNGATSATSDSYEPVTLTPPNLTSITISPTNASLPAQMPEQLVAVGTFSDSSVRTLQSVIWTSSNQNVTGITNNAGAAGFVYPANAGTTTVTVNAGSVSGSTQLNATGYLISLAVTPASPILLLNQTQQLTATGTYSDGSTKDLTSAVTWSTSNAAVASFSATASGLVITVGTGSANLTATLGTITARTNLTVEIVSPAISSLSSTSGSVGAYLGISGTNFGGLQGNGSVTFNGTAAPVLVWGNGSIIVQVPTGATSGPVQVTADGVASNTVQFNVTAAIPSVTSLSELVGMVGDVVTIVGSNFGTSGTVSFNGVPASTSNWGTNAIVTQIPVGAQTGPVAVNTGSLISNAITITIVAAAPTITAISPVSGDVGTVVTITGTNFDGLSSGPVVLFNGTAVPPTSWTSTQVVVTVPKGTKTGSLALRLGAVLSNSSTFTITPTGSQALSIFPANANLFVGQTLALSLNDDLEHDITGATWTLSNNSLAQLSNSDPPVLTAVAPGNFTVTATWSGLSATTQVTISAASISLPLGSVVWSLPASTAAFTVQKIMQASPSDGTTPDLIAIETDAQGNTWARGLTSSGQQLWHVIIGGIGGVDSVVATVPDNFGGLFAIVSNYSYPNTTNSIIDYSGTSGQQAWRYDSNGTFGYGTAASQTAQMAVAQNGNLFLVEVVNTSPGGTSSVVSLDAKAGTPSRWPLPSSYTSGYGFCNGPFASGQSAPTTGPISIGPDGSVYLQVSTFVSVSGGGGCNDPFSSTLQLLTLSPAGGLTPSTITSYSSSNCFCNGLLPGEVIPDGNGGVQASWIDIYGNVATGWQTTNVGGSGGKASLPQLSPAYLQGPDMVLGDQGTYFTTDGTQVVAVNETSGNQIWTWQPNSGTVEIIAATAGGGVAVKHVLNNQEDVVRVDASGNATYDTWGTPGGASGYGVISNSSYWVNGQWVGVSGDPVLEAVSGDTLDVAMTDWPSGAGVGGGGNRQGQNRPKLPEVVTFLPSHLSTPNDMGNDVPAFYTSMLGLAPTQANPGFRAVVPSINNIQNSGGKETSQTAIAEQTFFDAATGTARASNFITWMHQPLDALAFIGHSRDVDFDHPDKDFTTGIYFYYPKAPSVKCPDPFVPVIDALHAPWDIEYEGPGIVNGVLGIPVVLNLPCEPNWGDHKLVSLEESSAVALRTLSNSWTYMNSPWTLPNYHPELLVSEKIFPQAKILFFAACALNPTFAKAKEVPPFIQMWDVHDPTIDGVQETRQRALVVPNYIVVNLADGANQWVQILKFLTQGQTIQTAVLNANMVTHNEWKVLGNTQVKLGTGK